MAHQSRVFDVMAQRAAFALLWEQGCGKTKPVIDDFTRKYELDIVNALLVVAGDGAKRNWATDEIPVHMPERLLSRLKIMVWKGSSSSTKWHQRAFREFLAHSGPKFLAMSYDEFCTKNGKQAAWDLLRSHRVYYAVDEAHNIKAPSGKRAKAIVSSGKYATQRVTMTGTPIPDKPFDIYMQLKFLDEKIWDKIGCRNYFAFKNMFGVWEKRYVFRNGRSEPFPALVEYRNLHILYEHLQRLGDRVLKADVLDLPPKTYSKRYYDLSPQQLEIYERMKEEFLLQHRDGTFTDVTLPIVRMLRFQQVICGYLPFEDLMGNTGVKIIPGSNPRLDCLADAVEDIGHPFLVWARFTKDIDLILERFADLSISAARYDGAVSDDECERNKLRLQGGEIQALVLNPAKGRESLTLNQAKSTFYYNNTFRLLDRTQSEDRNHRKGQDTGVNITDIVANPDQAPIDMHMIENLRDKVELGSQVTGDKLREWI